MTDFKDLTVKEVRKYFNKKCSTNFEQKCINGMCPLSVGKRCVIDVIGLKEDNEDFNLHHEYNIEDTDTMEEIFGRILDRDVDEVIEGVYDDE